MLGIIRNSIGEFLHRRDLLFLFLFAVLIRAAYFILMLTQVSGQQLMSLAPDTVAYVFDARQLLMGHIRPDGAVTTYGPGFVVFLAVVFFLSGVGPWVTIILQILMSGLSCLIVYRLGRELTGSRPAGYIAAILLALSFTSISLATFILSDTLFFFLFVWGNLFFLLGLKKQRMSYIVWSGILIGVAALVRTIGQFWPVGMLAVVVFARYDGKFPRIPISRSRYILRGFVAPLIAIVIMALWAGRNYIAYDLPMVAFTGAGGPANVAALTEARLEGREKNQVMADWDEAYKQKTGKTDLDRIDLYRVYSSAARKALAAHPLEMLRTYIRLVWQNMNESNELVRVQLPKYKWTILEKMYWLRDQGLHVLPFWLTVAGFILMLVTGRWRALVFLGLYYVYFASMMGFTQWQGSRLFYPSQAASLISTGFLFAFLWRGMKSLIDRMTQHASRPGEFPFLSDFGNHMLAALRRRYFLVFSLMLLAGVAVLYHNFFPAGRMLKSADMIDAGVFFRHFLVSHIRTFGAIPHWNPYIFCGLPFVGAMHGDIFYPLSFLKFFISVPRAIGWTMILHVFLAGVFAYLAARQFRLSRLAATVTGMAYAFSGWLNSLVMPGHDGKMYVTALLPLVMLFLDRSFEKRPFLNTTLTAVTIGAIILSPHLLLAYFTFWAVAAYIVFRSVVLIVENEHRFRIVAGRTAQILYLIVLAMMIGAIQFIPSYDYVRHDSRRTLYQEDYGFASSWSLHPEDVVSQVVPEFAGTNLDPGDNRYWGRNGTKDNLETIGLVPLILAIIGVFHFRDRRRYFFGLLAAGSLIYALADTTPIFHLLYRLIPFIRMTRAPSMIMFLFAFSVAVLAGMGLDAVRAYRINPSRKLPPAAAVVSIVFPILLGLGALLFILAGNETLRLYAGLFYRQLFDMPAKLAAATANLSSIRLGFFCAFLLALITALLLRFSVRVRWGMLLLAAIPLLIMGNGIRVCRRFIRTIDYRQEFRLRPTAKFILDNVGYYRAFGFALNEIAFHIYYYGIPSLIGLHGNELVSYNRFLNFPPGSVRNFINPRFDDLVGARYILVHSHSDLTPVGHAPKTTPVVFSGDKFDVVKNLDCFPRTYLVGAYRVAPSTDSIFNLIYRGPDDLRRTALMKHAPESEIDSTFYPGDTAALDFYSTDSIAISTVCRTPKLLVLTDNYYRDWHVYIDGAESKPLETYAVFRGVVVPPGSHRVIWKIIPAAYNLGKTLTIAALIYLAGVSLAMIIFRRKRWRFR